MSATLTAEQMALLNMPGIISRPLGFGTHDPGLAELNRGAFDNAQTYEHPPLRPTVLQMTAKDAEELAQLFPLAAVPYRPTGRWIIVQDRLPRAKTKSGIILSDITRDEDMLRMNISRVAAIGPRAFTDPITGEALPPEFAVGDYVRTPRFTQDRPIEGQIPWRPLLPEGISAVIVDIDAILR